ARLARGELLEQNLEGAAVPHVRERRLEHIEGDLVPFRGVSLPGHELERGLLVDEASDQPRAGDAIDVDVLARNPPATLQVLLLRFRGGTGTGGGGVQSRVGRGNGRLGSLAPLSSEEVDREDLRQPLAETREVRLQLRTPRVMGGELVRRLGCYGSRIIRELS